MGQNYHLQWKQQPKSYVSKIHFNLAQIHNCYNFAIIIDCNSLFLRQTFCTIAACKVDLHQGTRHVHKSGKPFSRHCFNFIPTILRRAAEEHGPQRTVHTMCSLSTIKNEQLFSSLFFHFLNGLEMSMITFKWMLMFSCFFNPFFIFFREPNNKRLRMGCWV